MVSYLVEHVRALVTRLVGDWQLYRLYEVADRERLRDAGPLGNWTHKKALGLRAWDLV